jgi:hypothetical protein
LCHSNISKSILSNQNVGYKPAIGNRDDSGAIFGDLEEHRHGEVEMRARRVTPTTIVTRLSKIRRTKISSCNENGRTTRVTPLFIICTLQFKTRTTAKSTVEKCCT